MMETITLCKHNISTLAHWAPMVTPFCALSNAFVDGLLKRLMHTVGGYRLFSLEYLFEDATQEIPAPIYNMSLFFDVKGSDRIDEIRNVTVRGANGAEPAKTHAGVQATREKPAHLGGQKTINAPGGMFQAGVQGGNAQAQAARHNVFVQHIYNVFWQAQATSAREKARASEAFSGRLAVPLCKDLRHFVYKTGLQTGGAPGTAKATRQYGPLPAITHIEGVISHSDEAQAPVHSSLRMPVGALSPRQTARKTAEMFKSAGVPVVTGVAEALFARQTATARADGFIERTGATARSLVRPYAQGAYSIKQHADILKRRGLRYRAQLPEMLRIVLHPHLAEGSTAIAPTASPHDEDPRTAYAVPGNGPQEGKELQSAPSPGSVIAKATHATAQDGLHIAPVKLALADAQGTSADADAVMKRDQLGVLERIFRRLTSGVSIAQMEQRVQRRERKQAEETRRSQGAKTVAQQQPASNRRAAPPQGENAAHSEGPANQTPASDNRAAQLQRENAAHTGGSAQQDSDSRQATVVANGMYWREEYIHPPTPGKAPLDTRAQQAQARDAGNAADGAAGLDPTQQVGAPEAAVLTHFAPDLAKQAQMRAALPSVRADMAMRDTDAPSSPVSAAERSAPHRYMASIQPREKGVTLQSREAIHSGAFAAGQSRARTAMAALRPPEQILQHLPEKGMWMPSTHPQQAGPIPARTGAAANMPAPMRSTHTGQGEAGLLATYRRHAFPSTTVLGKSGAHIGMSLWERSFHGAVKARTSARPSMRQPAAAGAQAHAAITAKRAQSGEVGTAMLGGGYTPRDLHYAPYGAAQGMQPSDPVQELQHITKAAAPPQENAQTDVMQALPGWAQQFLKEGAAPDRTGGAPPNRGAQAKSAQTQAGPMPHTVAHAPPGQQTVWTAPGYMGRQAQIVHHQKEAPEQQQQKPVRVSDAEINRMANRVYKIIEDRLKVERRRMGF